MYVQSGDRFREDPWQLVSTVIQDAGVFEIMVQEVQDRILCRGKFYFAL